MDPAQYGRGPEQTLPDPTTVDFGKVNPGRDNVDGTGGEVGRALRTMGPNAKTGAKWGTTGSGLL